MISFEGFFCFMNQSAMKSQLRVFLFFFTVFGVSTFPPVIFAGNEYLLVFDGKDLVLSGQTDCIDLGEVLTGSNCNRTIRVKNNSQEVLWIANVRGSCGLSVPSWPRNHIEPGKEATIQIRYDCSRPGPINRNVTIHANTFKAKTIIQIRGKVISNE